MLAPSIATTLLRFHFFVVVLVDSSTSKFLLALHQIWAWWGLNYNHVALVWRNKVHLILSALASCFLNYTSVQFWFLVRMHQMRTSRPNRRRGVCRLQSLFDKVFTTSRELFHKYEGLRFGFNSLFNHTVSLTCRLVESLGYLRIKHEFTYTACMSRL